MPHKTRTDVSRRKFLATAALAGFAAPSIMRSQVRESATRRSSRDRLEEALARIADPKGEGKRACLTVYANAGRAADAADARARSGMSLGPLDGIIISIKDAFDVAGEPTRAGSKVLATAPPAAADAPTVSRLRSAGAVIVAKTNMVEFAYGGIGQNPHYGTPGNPADRTRIPGGSSSGAAVAVADGMCEIGIGADTSGSVRVPAALCGVVGFKPSQYRVPNDGVFPLSFTCDSVGPLAKTVAECAAADAAMAGEAAWTVEPASLSGLRLSIPQGRFVANLDSTVAARFGAACDGLGKVGVRMSEDAIPLLDDMVRVNSPFINAFSAIEAYAIHRERLASRGADYDPSVRAKLQAASGISAADYIARLRERTALVRAMNAYLADLDALMLPTVPIVAPPIADIADDEAERTTTLLLARNTVIANFFDLCALSIPCLRRDGLPVGVMLIARNGQDHKLFRIGAAVERFLASQI